ncbi:unnamed protein product, partial [marine sediment metagenome]
AEFALVAEAGNAYCLLIHTSTPSDKDYACCFPVEPEPQVF